MTGYSVVDMGCKLGNAIGELMKKGGQFFSDDVRLIEPGRCLGIDKQERFRSDLEKRGYQFQCLDVTAAGALDQLPESDYYLAWDFLEHLPDKDWVVAVIKVMLHKARKGIWIRMPSFEQDDTGEAQLRALGLRFAWTEWSGHPAHVLLQDVVSGVNAYKADACRPSICMKIKPGARVRSTSDIYVVPTDAPKNTVRYDATLGVKPEQAFEPPLVRQWEVIITV